MQRLVFAEASRTYQELYFFARLLLSDSEFFVLDFETRLYFLMRLGVEPIGACRCAVWQATLQIEWNRGYWCLRSRVQDVFVIAELRTREELVVGFDAGVV